MRDEEFERLAAAESERRQAEWEAQTGNPNFQQPYDENCPLCQREVEHTNQEHEDALARVGR